MKNLCKTEISGGRHQQQGVGAVEFALIAIPFFLILFGIMEFGRLMYIWNTVQEVTRNTARLAVVTDFSDPVAIAALKRRALFNSPNLPAALEVSEDTIVIEYLNEAGNLASPLPVGPTDNLTACLDPERATSCIRTVEVCVRLEPPSNSGNPQAPLRLCQTTQLIPFTPVLGLIGTSRTDGMLSGLQIPLSSVRMPAESLGFVPDSF